MSANMCTAGLEFFTEDGMFIKEPSSVSAISLITFRLPCDWNDIRLHIISKLRHGFCLEKIRFDNEYKSNTVVTQLEIQKMTDFNFSIEVILTQTAKLLLTRVLQKISDTEEIFRASAGIIEESEFPKITDDGFSIHVAGSPSRSPGQSYYLNNRCDGQPVLIVDWSS